MSYTTGQKPQKEKKMSFKVKDLSVNLEGSIYDELSTCTTQTKPTGSPCTISLFDWDNGPASRRHNLSALKAQLRRAVARV
jgi:hypothetical protein